MAWRFLRHKRPPVPPPPPVLAPQPVQPMPSPLPVLWLSTRPTDLTTHGRYPCAQRDERRVLAEVLGWQEAGPRPGIRR